MTTIGDVLNGAITQLKEYMSIIAMGPWKPNATKFSGVNDTHVVAIADGNEEFLDGYVVLAVGTRRFIVHKVDRISTNIHFYILQS